MRLGALLFLLGGFLLASAASAAPSAELRFAADAKSGAPYVFVDPKDPQNLLGFEYDIITRIAEILGRKPVFVQNEWDSLIPGLDRGDYDVAINGIEITPERSEQVLFSNPYYATFEQLVVRSDDSRIRSLKDMDGERIGTLKASLAHALLEKNSRAEIVFYEEESSGYQDVERGRIRGFFIDYPIALYYAFPNPNLKAVGDPVGKMRYGIAVSRTNPALRDELDRALSLMLKNGELERILSKWNLIHPFVVTELGLHASLENDTTEHGKVAAIAGSAPGLRERMQRYWNLLPLLLRGALTSLQISILAMVVAVAFGLLLSLSRLYGNKPASLAAQTTIEILRGTPLLIQLYLIFFGLPHLGIKLEPFWAAILGLGLNYGAYEAENYRAGIESVPRSQIEAANALALSSRQRFVHVIFPQAWRVILPPMTNDFISLIKDSSLVSVITMVELTTVYSQLASTYFDHLGLGIVVAVLYFALGYPFVRLARKLETNLKRKIP